MIHKQLEEGRASGGTREGQLLRPCGSDADIGMQSQQHERRLQEKWSVEEAKKDGRLAFWIVSVNVEYGSVDHLSNIRAV